jgi:hypothetical protein
MPDNCFPDNSLELTYRQLEAQYGELHSRSVVGALSGFGIVA